MPSVTSYTSEAIDLMFTGLTVISFNEQLSDYVLQASDGRKCVVMRSGSDVALTVPPHADVPLPVGTWITVIQADVGVIAFTQGTDVTLKSVVGLNSAGDGATVRMIQTEQDTWYLSGDLAV